MQYLVTAPPPVKKNYNFIDAIRGLAMMCIVADHCFTAGDINFPIKNLNFWVYISSVQLVKIGTINFFLMAGFLIGDKFADYSALDYLKRRFNNTFKPWIIWSLIFLYYVVTIWPRNGAISTWLLHDLATVYFLSNYWFIINFFICITILLIFKKQLYSIKLGLVLLLFTLFYSVNIYYQWIYPMHTTAVLGFVFFLWIGAQMQKRWVAIEKYIDATPLYVFIVAVIVSLAAAVVEIFILYNNKSIDPFNSLRITNILYSLAVFFLIVKIKRYNWLMKLKPRETTYGIYLIHYIIVFAFLAGWMGDFNYSIDSLSVPGMLALELARFIIVYVATFILVQVINMFSIRWVIGR